MNDFANLLQPILDLFQRLGVNPLFVLAIVFITWVIKKIDRKNKFKLGYVLIPLLASLLLFALIKPFVLESYVVNSMVHAAVSAYGYNLYANLFKRKKS